MNYPISIKHLIALIRWATAPVSWRGFKVIGLGVFIAAGLVMYLSASLIWLVGVPVLFISATEDFTGWAIVLLGVIGSLRAWLGRRCSERTSARSYIREASPQGRAAMAARAFSASLAVR